MRVLIEDIGDYGDDEFLQMYADMSPERQMKCDGYMRDADKKLCILSDRLIRLLLSREVGIEPKRVEILFEHSGKPYVKYENVFINYSHSGRFATAAAADTPIGIDIESLENRRQVSADRFASEREKAFIGTDLKKYLEIWTLKEAYFKCTGEGISGKLKTVEFDINNGSIAADKVGFDFRCDITDKYVMSLCYKKHLPD